MKLYIILILIFALTACENIDVSKISDQDLQRIADKAIVCNTPYMRFGQGCCLDQNNNSICDQDEKIASPAGVRNEQAVPANIYIPAASPGVFMWTGSRSGIAAGTLSGSTMQPTYFYLWFENNNTQTFNCDVIERYGEKENSRFSYDLTTGRSSLRMMIEPQTEFSYLTVAYEGNCRSEDKHAGVVLETQVSIEYG